MNYASSIGPPQKDLTNQVDKFLHLLRSEHYKNVQSIDMNQLYFETFLLKPDARPKNSFFSITSNELPQLLLNVVRESWTNRANAYIGVALRNSTTSGKTANCSHILFLVVDYDEFEGKKLKDILISEEKAMARENLLNLLRSETHLSPTMIVDSGNGFHVYYFLDAIVDTQKHAQSIERKIQWLAERYPSCPGDPAMKRLTQPIRLPGSCNVKNPDDIKFCNILDYQPERRYSFSEIPEADIKHPPVNRSKAKIESQRGSPYPFWECAFLRWMRDNPEEQSYHLWFAAASTLAYFGEDGRKAFHILSSGYPTYRETESDHLFDQILRTRSEGIGPITYDKIAEYGFAERDDDDVASPAIYIKHLHQNTLLSQMGITFKDNKLQFNPNIFADYLLGREQILIYEGNLFFKYQNGVWNPLNDYQMLRKIRELIQSVRKNIFSSSMGNSALEMLKLAAPQASALDTQKHLINVTNGMLDLNTTQLLQHNPSYLSTIRIPLAYDPQAICRRFERFLSEIMDDDPERIAVIQEFFGYLLTAETKIHKAFFLYGEGSNGKSLLLEILTHLIGPENVSNLTLTDLENPFRRSNLVGKTANIATENEISSKGFNSQYLKAVVSGDRIQVERKYENSMSYVPICKLVFAVNNLPYSPDKSHGLFRRMLIIPFERRFEGSQADKNLKEKLMVELPGILNWALEGLKRLREHDYNFTESAVIQSAVSRYIQEQNPMINFISEVIIKGGDQDRISKASVIEGYNTWCRCNGLGDSMKMSPQKFWNTFRANCKELGLPFEQRVSNGVRYLKSLKMNEFEASTLPAPSSLIP